MEGNQRLMHEPQIPVPPGWRNRHPRAPNLDSLAQYRALYKQSVEDPTAFYTGQARRELAWHRDFATTVYPAPGTPDGAGFTGPAAWFLEGELNAAYNCVDRHAFANPDKPAIIYEADEPGEGTTITYGELLERVCQLAQVLASLGVKKGDTVAVYLPMIPEALITILAIVRIGAVHSVVFAGFSASALRDRINDADSKIVITADQSTRGGKIIETKKIVDEALKETPQVQNVLVVKRTGNKHVPFNKRDRWYHEETAKFKTYSPPVPVNSEDPLFLLYTSGSTGKPKGLVHTTAGYLLHAALTARYVFDISGHDTVFTGADIGWVAGHTYVCYAPLLLGATTVVYEGTPVHPHPGRFWDIVDRHRASIFYIAPTALRLLKRAGDAVVLRYDLSSLRALGVVGEPCAPEVWEWYYHVVGRGRCTVQDTFWQTETGGPMIGACAGVTPMKPGSVTLPFLGVDVAILDPVLGAEITTAVAQGVLAFKKPWPGLTRGIWGDYARYVDTYFKPYRGYFFTGDSAARDKDGFIWILGRVDDVVNVSGHRLSTAEIEAAILEHPLVSENAVVGYTHALMGQAVAAFVSLRDDAGVPAETSGNAKTAAGHLQEIKSTLRLAVRKEIGPFAAPKEIFIVSDLPKTRSGKIMRRVLRKILNGEEKELGDISTLSNPGAVKSLIRVVNSDTGFRN